MKLVNVQTPVISVVVPCYNEEEVLRLTHDRLLRAMQDLNLPFEIIYVDDGSRDRTAVLLRDITHESANVGALFLSRNFGHQAAVSAGIDAAVGEAIVIIDADLQDPPELIGQMIERWRAGAEVVYGQRTDRQGESAFKLATAKAFYRALNSISEVEIPLDVGDFRLIDRKVADVMQTMRERDRFLRGMVAWVGFRQEALPYKRDARAAGETKYPLVKMLRLAFDGILSFSLAPLRVALTAGGATVGLSIVGILYALMIRLFTSHWVSGWTFLLITILFMGGMQLVVLGMVGEYVGRIYMASKDRPLYILRGQSGGLGGGTSDMKARGRFARTASTRA